jgi:fructokinase
MAVVSLDDQGKASYAFHFDGTTNFNWKAEEFPALRAEDWLHFGSIGAVIDPGYARVLEFVAATEATVSFDINVRPSTMPDRDEYFARVTAFMAAVGSGGGIVKASDEDITWLVDDPEGDPLGYAEAWAEEFGLALFVVTLGADGVGAVTRDGRRVQVPGFSIDVVDTVGAGDTFMAGFLAAYSRNPADLEDALRRGAAAAAIVCTRKGAHPPTAAEVDALLA